MSRKNKQLESMPMTEYNYLLKVCQVQSHSSNEIRMILFITNEIVNMGLDYEIDKIGNILVTKGKISLYPCVVAHMDTVHKLIDDYILFYTDIKKNGIKVDRRLWAGRVKSNNKTGIGGDDKCGVYACLYLLKVLPALKVVFFTKEETGCVGSNNIDKTFFDDCRYIIQLDRRNAFDFIDKHYRGDTTSHKFKSEVGHIRKTRGFKSTTGVITDSINLWVDGVGISCINISSGYHEPHSSSEYIMINELWNSVQLAREIITTLKPERYLSKPEPIQYKRVASIYRQCIICKHFVSDNQGFRPPVKQYEFVCYDCWQKEYQNKTKALPGSTQSQEKSDISQKIQLQCSVCSKYVAKCQGSYTSKDGIYEGQFVCYDCNIERDNMTAHETCAICGNEYINPFVNGSYMSVNPTVWHCNNCLSVKPDEELDEQQTKIVEQLGDNDTIECDICGKHKTKKEGRSAEDKECNFICYDCLHFFYEEED